VLDSLASEMLEDFGPYRVVRKIAVGGMAETYLVRQLGIEGVERTVVLKRILPTYVDNPEFVTMFLDEARLLAALSHPHIAQVFDVGQIGDGYYMVMEFVRGPSLGALLTASAQAGMGALPERPALAIALGIAEALAYVHSRQDELGRPMNIVHRDLNPANVMVSYDGAVKVIDFGIAKAATKVYETRTGVIKGTYGYIAPEQLTRAAQVDHRADVFALGILMYEMCVGQHPFDLSDEPNFVDRLLNARYKRPRRVISSFPKTLDRLIARCLSPHPEGRPQDVPQFIEELTAYMAERGMVPTMGDVAALALGLVPDAEGPQPLKPLTAVEEKRPLLRDVSHTVKLPQQEDGVGVSAQPSLASLLDSQERTVRVGTRHLPGAVGADGSETTISPMAQNLRAAAGARRQPSAADERSPHGFAAVRPVQSPRPRATDKGTPSTSTSRRQPRESPLKRALVVASSAALVLTVGVVAFVTARAIGGTGAPPGASPPTPAAGVESGRRLDAPIEHAPAKRTGTLTALQVLSEPTGAHVHVNGEDVPVVTPATVAIPEGAETVWIRVELPGFVTQQREVQAMAGQARFVMVPLDDPDAGPEAGQGAGTAKAPRDRRGIRRLP